MADKDTHDRRLTALRARLAQQQLDGWFVGREDMYQGEEVQPGEERLAYLTGFTGSAGFAVVFMEVGLYIYPYIRWHACNSRTDTQIFRRCS